MSVGIIYRYAECHYAYCRYAECRGANASFVNMALGQKWTFFKSLIQRLVKWQVGQMT